MASNKAYEDRHPLARAVMEGDIGAVRKLLAVSRTNVNMTDDGRTPLSLAVEYNHLDIAKLLVAHGANVNLAGKQSCTPLHYAWSREAVTFLLDAGALVDPLDMFNQTPLFRCVDQRNPQCVPLLLKAGADPRVRDALRRTAVDLALANAWARPIRASLGAAAAAATAAENR